MDTGFGGDVRNLATLTLDHDWITGGTATAGSGGGISNEGGTMTVSNSLVSGNTSVFTSNSGGDSGGIQNFGPNPITGTPGHLSIVNSTIANNTSALGGGVFSWCGGGGGPCSSSGAANTTSIVNSTIAHNDGGIRGTIGRRSARLPGQPLDSELDRRTQHCRLAGRRTPVQLRGDRDRVSRSQPRQRHRLRLPRPDDISGVDPQFSSTAAQDNGGDTDTLGLTAASPAVDAIPPGSAGCEGSDQRGIARPQGIGCDIGAFELSQPTEASAFAFEVAIASCAVSGPITINWGDGTTSLGAPRSGDIGPLVGTHTYAQAGIYSGSVSWTDVCADGDSAVVVDEKAVFSVKITDAPLSAGGLAIGARVGTPFAGQVATFADPNPFATSADYSVTVDWGDGTTSPGSVSSGGGRFVVTATHTYASPGVYQTTIAIHDVGGASAQARGVANVIAVGTSMK